MAKAKPAVRINLLLPLDIKQAIEDAAAITGQSVNGFAVSALAQAAQRILHEQEVTRLSARDQQQFLALLDDQDAVPNRALVTAAKRYEKQVRR